MESREKIIEAMKQTAVQAPRKITVPKWGDVYVRDVTLAEVEDQDADTADGKDKLRLARAAARVMCDEHGALLFDSSDADDVRLLSQQPWKLIQKVLAAASEEGN